MRPSLVPQESWRDQKEIPSQPFQKSDERANVAAGRGLGWRCNHPAGGLLHIETRRVGHRHMNRRRTFFTLLGVLLVSSAMSRQSQVPRLSAISKGGKGPPTIVLLHGYCSSEKDWLPFVKSIQLPRGARFLFPRGPETA